MNIQSLCHRDIVCISAGASLHEAAVLMCEEHVGALVVVTGEERPSVVGVLTDRDLALDVLGRQDGAGQRAGDLAKAPPAAVLGGASLEDAASAMEQAGVRRLLVVDEDGLVCGLVAAEDLLAAIAEELAGLVRALRSGIARERDERHVFTRPRGPRPVYPGFGMLAAQ
jgi:CBS domain-containing protein